MPPHPTPLMIIGDVAVSEWLAAPGGPLGRSTNSLSGEVDRVFPGIAGKKPLTALPLTLPPETAVPERWGGSASRAGKFRGRGN